jgi:hypothetical protein
MKVKVEGEKAERPSSAAGRAGRTLNLGEP